MTRATDVASVPRSRRWFHTFGDDPDEAAELEELIANRVAEALGASRAPNEEVAHILEGHRAFLHYRFGRHLRNYRTWGRKYALAFRVA